MIQHHTKRVADDFMSIAEGLFPIIDSCQRLSKLNLTGCRSIKVVDRRRFFEVGFPRNQQYRILLKQSCRLGKRENSRPKSLGFSARYVRVVGKIINYAVY